MSELKTVAWESVLSHVAQKEESIRRQSVVARPADRGPRVAADDQALRSDSAQITLDEIEPNWPLDRDSAQIDKEGEAPPCSPRELKWSDALRLDRGHRP